MRGWAHAVCKCRLLKHMHLPGLNSLRTALKGDMSYLGLGLGCSAPACYWLCSCNCHEVSAQIYRGLQPEAKWQACHRD